MPLTNQVTGDNATFSYSTSGTANSYTAAGNIEDITGNKITVTEVKTTKLDSAAELSQPGLPDYGQVGVKLRWLKTFVTLALGWVTNKTRLWFQVVVTDPATTNTGTLTFTGYVKELDPVGQLVNNKEVITDVTLKVDGGSLTFT